MKPAKHLGKGQYQIIIELIIFIIGIVITSYTISLFSDVKAGSTTVALNDNMNLVAEDIATSVVKASTVPNGIQRIKIPGKLAGITYRVTLNGDTNQLIVANLRDSSVGTSKQIFNIGQVNRISNSEVSSSALAIEVRYENNIIRIRRGR